MEFWNLWFKYEPWFQVGEKPAFYKPPIFSLQVLRFPFRKVIFLPVVPEHLQQMMIAPSPQVQLSSPGLIWLLIYGCGIFHHCKLRWETGKILVFNRKYTSSNWWIFHLISFIMLVFFSGGTLSYTITGIINYAIDCMAFFLDDDSWP